MISIFGIVPHYITCLNCKSKINIDYNNVNKTLYDICDNLKSNPSDYESDIAGVIISQLSEKVVFDFSYEGVSLIKCAEWDLYPYIKNQILNQTNE
jgi:hypothetical protein